MSAGNSKRASAGPVGSANEPEEQMIYCKPKVWTLPIVDKCNPIIEFFMSNVCTEPSDFVSVLCRSKLILVFCCCLFPTKCGLYALVLTLVVNNLLKEQDTRQSAAEKVSGSVCRAH